MKGNKKGEMEGICGKGKGKGWETGKGINEGEE